MTELKYYKLFHRASALTSPEFISVVEFGKGDEVYCKSEADKVIADLEESHKKEVEQLLMEIVELKADYREACGRLQTANLVKDEQLAATRHSNHKRCLAMKQWCYDRWIRAYHSNELEKTRFYVRWQKHWEELAKKPTWAKFLQLIHKGTNK